MRRHHTDPERALPSPREAVRRAVGAISEVLSELPVNLQNVLQAIVEQARIVAGAEYAALGITADPSRSFEPWVYSGISSEAAASIGRHPRPRGLLGAVPRKGRTIRRRDLQRDSRHMGFPAHHPDMHSFLGVPIRYRGQSVGNLYLANKVGAHEFSAEDQWAVELLADHAGVALQVAGIDELRATVDAERARLQTILGSAPHGILYVEAASGRLMANPAAIQLLGRSPDPESGLSQFVTQIQCPAGLPPTLDELASSLGGQTVRGEECSIVRPDGTQVPVLVSIAPVLGQSDRVIGEVVVFEDITSIRQLQEQRTKYILSISHGLRTPLTLVQGQSQLLLRAMEQAGVNGMMHRSTETVVEAARRMSVMLLDLVDLMELEAGRELKLNKTSLDVPVFVQDVISRLAGLVDTSRISTDGPETLPTVLADSSRLERILINLLANALKYSRPDTPVTISLSQRDADILIRVSDQGKGILPEDVPLLFQPYQRDRLARGSQESLGLGLYVTKGLVEAHGGHIWVESRPGEGSSFTFSLPLSQED